MSDILSIKDANGNWSSIPAITGLSAYQVALKNGFIGTEEEWLESLKGDPGIGGAVGPVGPAGPGVPAGGASGQILSKKTAANYDAQWIDPPQPESTGVLSFHGRTGAVTPQPGDYNASMVGARPSTWVPDASDVGAVSTTGNSSNTTVEFSQASSRTDISTGEKLSVIFGKIAKWFADLKTVAFTGSYTDLTNKPTIPSSASDIGALPDSGGTLTGDLRIKGSGNFGTKINLGDGDYVHIAEPTDDCLEIKAKKINFVVSATTDDKFTLNGEAIGSGGTPSSFPASGLTGTVAISNGGTGSTSAAAALYALINGSSALTSSSIVTGDYIAIGDVSAATGKKITLSDLKTALGSSGGSGGEVIAGTYTGGSSMPSSSASVQSAKSVNLGFQPSFVFVGILGGGSAPWYEYNASSGSLQKMNIMVEAAYACPGYPFNGEQNSTDCAVLEVTSSGFSVRNARGTSGDGEAYRLNKSGETYFYLAVK